MKNKHCDLISEFELQNQHLGSELSTKTSKQKAANIELREIGYATRHLQKSLFTDEKV